jgi:hypothetical protein
MTLVVKWNEAALDAIRQTHLGPPMVARALAIVHTCIYDAWSPSDSVAVGTRFGGFFRRPMTSPEKEEAISYAAYRALRDLFPQALFPSGVTPQYETLMTSLGYDPSVTATDPATGSGLGNLVAHAVLAFRDGDGANQNNYLPPTTPPPPPPPPSSYDDFTGYAPVNTPTAINDPDRWQPLDVPIANAAAPPPRTGGPCATVADSTPPALPTPTGTKQQVFSGPHWGLVTPFALTSGDQFRPIIGPAKSADALYRIQADQILAYSANLTDEQKVIAEYWADGPLSELPPGHWCLFAQCVSQRGGHDLDADVQLFFALTNAIFDASIACWDAKRAYDSVRPITAIHHLYTGQQVEAWAGPYQGTKCINGQDWKPYQAATVVTPPFAEYLSGHSTFSAAGAEILKRFTGSDNFGASYTQPAGTSRVEPKQAGKPYFVPATDVTLYWATFTDAAGQAAISRRYGGIHFVQGDLDGRMMGRMVAAQAWDKAQAYIQGTV